VQSEYWEGRVCVHAMKQWWNGGTAPFLLLAPDGGEGLAEGLVRFMHWRKGS
jgi:hypothetical protein